MKNFKPSVTGQGNWRAAESWEWIQIWLCSKRHVSRVLRCCLQFCEEFMALQSFICKANQILSVLFEFRMFYNLALTEVPQRAQAEQHWEKVKETRTEYTLSSKWGLQFHTALLMRKQLIIFLQIIAKSHGESKENILSFVTEAISSNFFRSGM